MKLMSGYYALPFGCQRVEPRTNESIDAFEKRLRRLAKSYLRWEKSFRVHRVGDVVIWERVPNGQHRKLDHWHALAPGESARLPAVDPTLQIKRAKATARYLKSSGKGQFRVALDAGDLVVTRITAPETGTRQMANR